ncbi:DUF1345 domain-containing protein [Mesorhizobium sp. ASY16-5R]|uniref:DUF1345 domain-containing protein n=1 Tax=Mesorhizobium sp. ASY16-5R TaxID=3445772 RepID=UPI003FA1734D
MTWHNRRASFYYALAAGAAVLVVLLIVAPAYAVATAANAFFAVYLVLSAIKLRYLSAGYLHKHAARVDVPEWTIFVVTLFAVAVTVVSLFRLINVVNHPTVPQLALALASVALGWVTVHTMAAFHYAHIYWSPPHIRSDGSAPRQGGLEFPQTPEPGGYEFVYFAFVIGMTAQTSDVAITSTEMRKLSIVHGVVSFFFNTVLVAAAVNLAVSFAG